VRFQAGSDERLFGIRQRVVRVQPLLFGNVLELVDFFQDFVPFFWLELGQFLKNFSFTHGDKLGLVGLLSKHPSERRDAVLRRLFQIAEPPQHNGRLFAK